MAVIVAATTEGTRAMTHPIHNISFPITEPGALAQDQAYFLLREGGEELRLRFHDYGEIYRRPGLYEQLFYERLRCNSPNKARDVLLKVLADNQQDVHSLRVLDLGAGNGMMGDLLDAARVVGVDSEGAMATDVGPIDSSTATQLAVGSAGRAVLRGSDGQTWRFVDEFTWEPWLTKTQQVALS